MRKYKYVSTSVVSSGGDTPDSTGRELLTFTTYLIHLIVYVMLLSSLHIRVTNLINVSNRINVKVEILIWLLKLKRASIVVQYVSF